jgi:hypothetical protein
MTSIVDDKKEKIINNLICIVISNDFKEFILNMNKSFDQSTINKCIETINDFNTESIQNLIDTVIVYNQLLINRSKHYFFDDNSGYLAIQYLCFQIYQNIETLEFSEDVNISEKIINMYRYKRINKTLSDEEIDDLFLKK